MSQTTELSLTPDTQLRATLPIAEMPSPLAILDAAVRGGVTQENVSVVKELIAMAREERAEQAKAAFAKAFFQLRKNMPEIHADKEAKTKSGEPAYAYCSETEIAKKLEPHLMAYGFAMLFGQSASDGRITVTVTLMHEQGHSETRDFSVRSGAPNAMKDAAMCDTGGATTAWRHLMIKMFGLKSRIQENQDATIEGEKISRAQVQYLEEQVRETGSDLVKFLTLAGAPSIAEIRTGSYDVLVRALAAKARK